MSRVNGVGNWDCRNATSKIRERDVLVKVFGRRAVELCKGVDLRVQSDELRLLNLDGLQTLTIARLQHQLHQPPKDRRWLPVGALEASHPTGPAGDLAVKIEQSRSMRAVALHGRQSRK